jgi:hypothetical protein
MPVAALKSASESVVGRLYLVSTTIINNIMSPMGFCLLPGELRECMYLYMTLLSLSLSLSMTLWLKSGRASGAVPESRETTGPWEVERPKRASRGMVESTCK